MGDVQLAAHPDVAFTVVTDPVQWATPVAALGACQQAEPFTGALIGAEYIDQQGVTRSLEQNEIAEVACQRIADFVGAIGFLYSSVADDGSCASTASFPAIIDDQATPGNCPVLPQPLCAPPSTQLPYICQCSKFLPPDATSSASSVTATIEMPPAARVRMLATRHGISFASVSKALSNLTHVPTDFIHINDAALVDEKTHKFRIAATIYSATEEESKKVREDLEYPGIKDISGIKYSNGHSEPVYLTSDGYTHSKSVTHADAKALSNETKKNKSNGVLVYFISVLGVCAIAAVGLLIAVRQVRKRRTRNKVKPEGEDTFNFATPTTILVQGRDDDSDLENDLEVPDDDNVIEM